MCSCTGITMPQRSPLIVAECKFFSNASCILGIHLTIDTASVANKRHAMSQSPSPLFLINNSAIHGRTITIQFSAVIILTGRVVLSRLRLRDPFLPLNDFGPSKTSLFTKEGQCFRYVVKVNDWLCYRGLPTIS